MQSFLFAGENKLCYLHMQSFLFAERVPNYVEIHCYATVQSSSQAVDDVCVEVQQKIVNSCLKNFTA